MKITWIAIVDWTLFIGIITQMVLLVVDPGKTFMLIGMLNVCLYCVHLVHEIEHPKKTPKE